MAKTLIDIQSNVIEKLDLIAKKRKVSRAALVRIAIDTWLEKQTVNNKPSNAFGILKDKKPKDGVIVQRKLRGEWK